MCRKTEARAVYLRSRQSAQEVRPLIAKIVGAIRRKGPFKVHSLHTDTTCQVTGVDDSLFDSQGNRRNVEHRGIATATVLSFYSVDNITMP
jgi:hypothetical protein